MKKIKLKSLIDANADNIDDIYGNIVEELNLNKKAESNKQINSLLNKAKQNPAGRGQALQEHFVEQRQPFPNRKRRPFQVQPRLPGKLFGLRPGKRKRNPFDKPLHRH